MKTSGNIVDVLKGIIYPGSLFIENGRITKILRDSCTYDRFILPGFVDSHLHVESSMLVPSEVARVAVVHGTVAIVSDPHEIGNVLGPEGVKYMIGNGRTVPFKFYFGAPSCVPATPFETSGATIGVREVEDLLQMEAVKFLSEVMNFPGVLNGDPLLLSKIAAARRLGKKIDGHAPGLRGPDLMKYIDTGITTDHECVTIDEAIDKVKYGMKILIREGSAAKNFHALAPLIGRYPENCMFCSDDLHPNDLIAGQINRLVKRSLQHGTDLMNVLKCASVNPVLHYGLDVGLLRKDDWADFLLVDNLENLDILETYVNGEMVAAQGKTLLRALKPEIVNNFGASKKDISQFVVRESGGLMQVIAALDGQIITEHLKAIPKIESGLAVSDPSRDILKITVVNRYHDVDPAVGFVKGFGLKTGAMASSVAHDSHNIVAVGVEDEAICQAVNMVIEHRGGICVVDGDMNEILPLPIAGLMSDETGAKVATRYLRMEQLASRLGSRLVSPFMTLSFMTLLVIPRLKLSDKGLFDGTRFQFTNLFSDEQQ